jgi:hypothetical protein
VESVAAREERPQLGVRRGSVGEGDERERYRGNVCMKTKVRRTKTRRSSIFFSYGKRSSLSPTGIAGRTVPLQLLPLPEVGILLIYPWKLFGCLLYRARRPQEETAAARHGRAGGQQSPEGIVAMGMGEDLMQLKRTKTMGHAQQMRSSM